MISSWPRGKRTRCGNSSNTPFDTSAVRSFGAEKASTKRVSTPRPAISLSKSTLVISGRQRWTPCWAMPARRINVWAGGHWWASTRSCAKWSNRTCKGSKTPEAFAMSDPRRLYPLSGKRVWVAGHRGMVGSALLRRLARENCEVLTAAHYELDLRRQADVDSFVARTRPEAVFLAAARVGGIMANDRSPASFLYDNLLIAANVIEAAHRHGVEKLLNLGRSEEHTSELQS